MNKYYCQFEGLSTKKRPLYLKFLIRSDQLRDSLLIEMVWLGRNSLRPAMRTSKPKRACGTAPAQPARLPASDVLTRIRGLIEQGQILPGSKLPPERALAAELGAGR